MGKGDIKTKKGKRTAGSYGVSRPKPSSILKAKVKIAKEEKEKGIKKVVAKRVAKPTAEKVAPKAKAEKVETTETAPAKKKATKKSEE